MSTPTPTGQHAARDDRDLVVFERTFSAPAEDVWAAVTESDRLARWIGTWSGDPTEGWIRFAMNAEGDDVPDERYDILACEAPRLLAVRSEDQFGVWELELEIVSRDGGTVLTLTQTVLDRTTVENTGPGWEYYLDRLVAAETGGDVASIDFDDYYPAMQAYYQALADRIPAPE